MKKIIILLAFLFSSVSAFAGYDLSQLKHLNDKVGDGVNPYENQTFACRVTVDENSNTLTLSQKGAYSPSISLNGSLIKDVKQDGVDLILKTEKKKNPTKGLCGDFVSAHSLRTIAVINDSSIEISWKYRCGSFNPKHSTDTFTCVFD